MDRKDDTTGVKSFTSTGNDSDESVYEANDDDSSQPSFFQLSLPVPTPALSVATRPTQAAETTSPLPPTDVIITQDRLDTRFLIAMMAMAGYVEGFCLLVYGTFPNMMTGNTVKLVESMLNGRWNKILYFSSMILCYMVGGSIFVQWKDYAKNNMNTQTSFIKTLTPPPPTTTTTTTTTTTITTSKQLADIDYRSTLTRGVALLSMCTLIASDMMFGGIKGIRLPLLGMAFGILHAYAIDLIGVVPFAMTGHITKIGTGLTNDYIIQRRDKSTMMNKKKLAFDATPTSSHTHRYNPKGYQTSIRGLAAFMGMALLANIVSTLSAKSIHVSTLLQSRLGMTLAISYGLLLRWYDRQCGKIDAAKQHQQLP
jgi:uncharacterized membrane protein YoaK (UPF0700 family)